MPERDDADDDPVTLTCKICILPVHGAEAVVEGKNLNHMTK